MPTTPQLIASTALDNGWVMYPSRNQGSAVFRRRSQTVIVEYSVRGGVTYASTNSSFIQGKGKLARVLTLLESK